MPKSMRWNILRTLDQVGTCYKQDFYLLLGTNPTSMFSSLLANGFVEVKEIPKQGYRRTSDEKQAIVRITKKGRLAYLEHEDDPRYYKTTFPGKNYFDHKNVKNELWPFLTQQKINILFTAAKVSVFPLEKPSLEYLWYTLSKVANQGVMKKLKDNYLDKRIDVLDEKEKLDYLKSVLDQGIYYTKKEFKTFTRYLSFASDDTFKGVKWEGLYIQTNTCLVVFVSSYGKNKRVYLPSQQLGNLLERIKHTFCNVNNPITNVRRVVPCLSDTSDSKKTYYHDVNALLVSIGDSLTYSSATGYAHGITKPKRKRSAEYEFVDSSSARFKMIFTIQDNLTGVDKLFYLTSRSLEDWYQEMINIIHDCDDLEVSKYNKAIPGYYKKYKSPALYMPVHEIKTYNTICSAKYSDFTFITDKKMVNAISHSVKMLKGLHFIETRKEVLVAHGYEYEEDRAGDELTFDNYFLYDSNGNVAGIKMLEEFFRSKGKEVKNYSDYQNIPSWCGLDEKKQKTFYNNIVRGGVNLEKVFKICDEHLIDLTTSDKKKTRRNKEGINFVLDSKHKKMFKAIKDSKNYKSNAALVKTLIIPVLEKEYEQLNINQAGK